MSRSFEEAVKGWLAQNEPSFRAEAKADGTLEIEVMDVIGGGIFYDGVTAKSVRRALESNPDAKSIRVLVNSPGGAVPDGVAIKNLLQRHSARVVVEVLGWAASAASVIAMAGDEILMHEGALMMIHRASNIVWGNADDMAHMQTTLEKVDESILDTYVSRTGGDRETIREMVAAETWMTASEAVENGFADRVVSAPSKGGDDKSEARAEAAAKRRAKRERDLAAAQGLSANESRPAPAVNQDTIDLSAVPHEELMRQVEANERRERNVVLPRAIPAPEKPSPLGNLFNGHRNLTP